MKGGGKGREGRRREGERGKERGKERERCMRAYGLCHTYKQPVILSSCFGLFLFCLFHLQQSDKNVDM